MTHVSSTPIAIGAGNPLFDLSISLGQRVERLRKRRLLKKLLDYPDYALNDMGMTRGDIDWVLTLPHTVDATAELKRLKDWRHKTRLSKAR